MAAAEILGNIFGASGTDKGPSCHAYHRFYAHALSAFRDDEFNMLEIGYADGCSATAWLSYFTRARVYAMDTADPPSKTHDRLAVIKGDQSSPADLDAVANAVGKARVIIDDGSHIPSHQIGAFNKLFADVLEPGGVYIIEDVETSYWRRGALYGRQCCYGPDHPENVVTVFKRAVDASVNREFLGGPLALTTEAVAPLDPRACRWISSVEFGSNCIIVRKTTAADLEKYHDRAPYRFAAFL